MRVTPDRLIHRSCLTVVEDVCLTPWMSTCARLDAFHMPESLFDEWMAQQYEALWPDLFEPAVVEPAVDFLARLAGTGPLPWNSESEPAASPSLSAGAAFGYAESSCPQPWPPSCSPHQAASDIEVTIGDFATTTVDGRFRLVYLLRNTITNLTTQDEQVAGFRNAAAHLEPGGYFVIENYVPELRRLPPGEITHVFTATPAHLGFEEYDIANSDCDLSPLLADRRPAQDQFSSPHRYVWPAELDLMARLAGLILKQRRSDWRWRAHSPARAAATSPSGRRLRSRSDQ